MKDKNLNTEETANSDLCAVGRSSLFINPKEWNLFQWCYAYVLWSLIGCGLINLIVWAFS